MFSYDGLQWCSALSYRGLPCFTSCTVATPLLHLVVLAWPVIPLMQVCQSLVHARITPCHSLMEISQYLLSQSLRDDGLKCPSGSSLRLVVNAILDCELIPKLQESESSLGERLEVLALWFLVSTQQRAKSKIIQLCLSECVACVCCQQLQSGNCNLCCWR